MERKGRAEKMKHLSAWIWPSVPCVLLSGLVHTSDGDIRSFAEIFTSAGFLMSVVFWSVPLAVCAYFVLAASLAGGARGYVFAVIPVSCVFGALLAFFGSTAVTTGQFIWSIFGSGLIFLAILSLAALPSGMIMDRRRRGSTPQDDRLL